MYLTSSIWVMILIEIIGHARSVGSFQTDLIGDILSIITMGTVQLIGNCTGANDAAPQTNYWVYTSNNPSTHTIVTKSSSNICGGRTKIIFLTHGWYWDASVPHIQDLKDAYLTRYSNACVIATNWGAYAQQNYQSAYCAAPGVALNNALFICQLNSDTGVPLNDLHIVGHSMGAHIYGMVGNLVQSICSSKIGRITGLDPAGPLYQFLAVKDRLDPTDAIFVDVIHTNQGKYGYIGSCGHLDAYANCGYVQPGCWQEAMALGDFLNLLSNYISCNHRRSVLIFQESILSDDFKANPCFACGFLICSTYSSENKVIGESGSTPGSVRNYEFSTNSKSPYATG